MHSRTPIASDDQTAALLSEYDRLIDTHVYHSRFAVTIFPLILGTFGGLAFISGSQIVTPLAFLYLFGLLMGAMNLCHRIAIQTGIRLIESEAKLNYHLNFHGDMRLSRFTRTERTGPDWLYLIPMASVVVILLILLWIAAADAPESGKFQALVYIQNLFQGSASGADTLIAIPLFLSIVSGISMIISEFKFQRSLDLEADDDYDDSEEGEVNPGVGEFLLRKQARKIKRY